MEPSPNAIFQVDGVCATRRWLAATAANVLEELSRGHFTLILCSSKTRAELEQISRSSNPPSVRLRERWSLVHSTVHTLTSPYPCTRVRRLPSRRAHGHTPMWCTTPHRTAEQLRVEIEGLSDMSVEDVARECSVTLLRARLAKLRNTTTVSYPRSQPSCAEPSPRGTNGARLVAPRRRLRTRRCTRSISASP